MMRYHEANAFYGQKGKQLGDVLMYITSDGITENVHGYRVTSFNGFDPDKLEYMATVKETGLKNWDEAYDKIFALTTSA